MPNLVERWTVALADLRKIAGHAYHSGVVGGDVIEVVRHSDHLAEVERVEMEELDKHANLTEQFSKKLKEVAAERDQARHHRDEELRERLLNRLTADANIRGLAEDAFGPYAGPLAWQRLREVFRVALDSIHEEADGG